MNQIRKTDTCTKSQLEYLILYNNMLNTEEPYHLENEKINDYTILNDELELKAKMAQDESEESSEGEEDTVTA